MRDCESCKNHTDKGCTKWKCEFEPTTKNDLGVDCIDKLIADCEKMSFDIDFFNKPLKVVALDAVKNIVKELPSVTPQVPKCKECKWWKDSDGEYRRGCGAESICHINTDKVYQGEGYCYMFSPKADMREVSVKIVNRGKCMLCGRELTEGLFFCKECEIKAESENP